MLQVQIPHFDAILINTNEFPSYVADDSTKMNQKDVSKFLEYDPFQHINNKNPSTFWGTTFHMIFLGAGSLIFFLPKKFVSIGYLNGCLLTLLILLFHRHNMRSILGSAYDICKYKKISTITYAELVYEAFDIKVINRFAPLAKLLIQLDLILVWYNSTIFFYLLISEYFQTVCTQVLQVDVSLQQVMILLLVPTLVLGSIHKLKYLEPFSVLGFVFSCMTGVVILLYIFTDQHSWQWPTNQLTVSQVPMFVGSILVNINIAGMIIPLRDEMKYPRKFVEPLGVMTFAYTTIAFVYCSLAVIFAAKYGLNVPDNLTLILPPKSILTQISLFLYAISLLFTHTLLMHVPYDVILNDFLRHSKKLSYSKIKEHGLKCLLIVVCFALAYPNPDLSLFFSISGTVGTSIDSIIFPAVIQILVKWKVGVSGLKFTKILLKNLVILVIGVSLVVAGIQDCMQI